MCRNCFCELSYLSSITKLLLEYLVGKLITCIYSYSIKLLYYFIFSNSFPVDSLDYFSKLPASNYLICCCRLAHQAPLSMGFPRREYWKELLFPAVENLLTQGSCIPCLLHWWADSLPLIHQGSPSYLITRIIFVILFSCFISEIYSGFQNVVK